MLRPFILKEASDLKSLAAELLRARTSDAQAEAAHARLADANPHLDPDKIGAGTVVLVPDLPVFKTSATTSIQAGPFGDFSALVSNALEAAAERAKAGAGDREKDRAEVAAAVKSAIFKRLTANDPDTQRQADEALKAADADATADKQAQEILATTSRGVLAALDALGKVVK